MAPLNLSLSFSQSCLCCCCYQSKGPDDLGAAEWHQHPVERTLDKTTITQRGAATRTVSTKLKEQSSVCFQPDWRKKSTQQLCLQGICSILLLPTQTHPWKNVFPNVEGLTGLYTHKFNESYFFYLSDLLFCMLYSS